MAKSIYESSSLKSAVKVRRPHVRTPDVPLSPRTIEVLEENERIIKKQETFGNRRGRVIRTY